MGIMYCKIIFAVISFCVFVYLAIKRSRELLLLPMLLFIITILPGGVNICAMRLSLFSSLFGLYVFWNGMLKRGKRFVIPLYLYAGAVLFCYETIVSLFEVALDVCIAGYLFLNLVMWGVFYVYAYLMRNRHRAIKGTITVSRVFELAAESSPFVVLGGGVMVAMLVLQGGNGICGVVILLYLLLYLWYIYFHTPLYLENRDGGEMVSGIYGQLLEDEGCGIPDDGVVEDSRIIYALMTLFEKEHIYKNVDIKIGNVALMIGTNKTYLSRALNQRLSKNFCQFVNYYRVRDACTMFIENPDMEMRDIAELCGFSTSSNFSIVFKYNTGFTPGDWCRMVKNKLENDEDVWVDDFLL